ncbi:hypothetical protein K492DRAFT_36992 [Lichtheimia hyalospora FSU 10163]|nr:hypothetical protein K492DRAFT_36992 [Lichtheimia hyalospora FSU 10163]
MPLLLLHGPIHVCLLLLLFSIYSVITHMDVDVDLPRDWPHNDQEQSTRSMHSSPSPSAQHIRFGPRSRGYDDDDDDPGCWRKWCKYLFLGILIWLVFLKYGDILTWGGWRDSPAASVCQGHHSIVWDDLPSSILLEKNAKVTIEGHVTGGKINVHRGSRKGSIETRVRTNSPTLLDALEYEYQPGENTDLELRFPAMSVMSQHDCLEIEMDIWVPERSEELHVEGSNVVVDVVDALDGMDWLDIKTINAMIRMQGGWFGQRLELETEHGEINTAGPIVTSDNAHMKAIGGAIRVGSIMSRNTIDLKATNGAIHVSGSLQADSQITAETSNAEIHLDTVKARDLDVITSNGWIQLNHAIAPHITAQTTNDRINVQVEDVVEPNVELITSNGPIIAHVTTYFAGSIQVSTSANNQAIVQDAWNRVDLDIDEPSMKQGNRLGGGNGHLTLSTTNADASIFLDIQPDIGHGDHLNN